VSGRRAYAFRAELVITEVGVAGEEPYPQVRESAGEAPPQYPPLEEDEV
jgi:hypothetical protein